MAISFDCRKCGQEYTVSDDKAGKRLRCRNCDAPVRVPEAEQDYDEYEDDYEPERNRPSAKSRKSSSRKKSGSTKKRRRQKNAFGGQKAVLIGGGAVAAIAVVLIVVIFVLPSDDSGDGSNSTDSGTIALTDGGNSPDPAGETAEQNSTGTSQAGSASTPESPRPPINAMHYLTIRKSMKRMGIAFRYTGGGGRTFTPDSAKKPEYFDKDGRLHLSWRVHLLPWVGEHELYRKFKLDEPWDSPTNSQLANEMPDIYRSPDTPADSNLTRIRAFEGVWAGNSGEKETLAMVTPGFALRDRDVLDGLSETAMLVEVGPDKAVEWTKPTALDIAPTVKGEMMQGPKVPISQVLGNTASGVPTLFCDGSVRLIRQDALWTRIVSPADGGMALNLDEYSLVPKMPWDLEPKRTGPLHLAYMADDCVAVGILRPKSLLESPELASEADQRTLNMLVPGTRELDLSQVELAVAWLGLKGKTPWIAVQFAGPVSLEDAQKQLGKEAVQLDEKTFLVASEDRLMTLFVPQEDNSQSKPAQQLIELLNGTPADSQAFLAMLPMALIDHSQNSPTLAGISMLPLLRNKTLRGIVETSRTLEVNAGQSTRDALDQAQHD